VAFNRRDVNVAVDVPETRDPLVDAYRVSLSGAGPSVPGARDGADGVRVDDEGSVLGFQEPEESFLHCRDFSVKRRLPGTQRPFPLRDDFSGSSAATTHPSPVDVLKDPSVQACRGLDRTDSGGSDHGAW
jgi:hypothetical protein